MAPAIRILGIDPGLRKTGWGVVVSEGSKLSFVACGCVESDGALPLGQARGIALVVTALAGLDVAEYAANLVKKTVVGVGHADKKQVQAMIRVLLPKAETSSADAADALAVAICHAQHRGMKALVAQMRAAG